MPETTQVMRMRRRRRAKQSHSPNHKTGLAIAISTSLFIVVLGIAFSLLYANLSADLPSIETLPALLDPPDGSLLQPTRFYDRSGTQLLATLADPAASERRFAGLPASFGDSVVRASSASDTLPVSLILTTVATRQPDFWDSPGFTWSELTSNQPTTIAQQLVDDLLLWQETPGLRRVIRERLLASQITQVYGHARVLAWYLNSAKYGDLIYGAESASKAYFGKPASQLNLAESAILAAVAEVPSINPFTAPDLARQRGQDVLAQLLSAGVITSVEVETSGFDQLQFQSPSPAVHGDAGTFINLVMEQLSQHFNRERIERGGFRIITTLDADLQAQANCAITVQIEHMSLPGSQPDGEAACPAARLLPALRENRIQLPSQIDSQALVLDPTNGQLLALASIETRQDATSATQTQYTSENPYSTYPSGTIITPFIYLSGFTRGFSPATLVWDVPPAGATLTTEDLNHYHGPVRARLALANDYLAPAAQILDQVGIENVLKIASQMNAPLQNVNTSSFQDENTSLSGLLDESNASLLQLSQAFGVFSNNGALVGSAPTDAEHSIEPLATLLMEDYLGNVWLGEPALSGRRDLTSRPVISPQLAYLVTNSLSDESARWPRLGHPNALEIGKPAAVKYGSTSDGSGFWTIGYLPQLVVGVHMAYPQEKLPTAISQESIMDIWHSLVQYASQELPVQDWSPPPGIVQMVVCDPSGMLPDKDCPSTVSEVFLEGNTPTQVDDLYQSLQVNRETGRMATIFTPPEFIENRLYMTIPPWALDWAKAANLPIPPDSYDVIQASSANPDAAAHINQPVMLSYVRDQVKITGSANGAGFSSYRLSIGKGLYPSDWLQIGEEGSQPVENGTLGVWDTTGLNGLYSIQLTLIRQDQSIETSIVQVTVDNVAPVITRIYPADGQTLSIPENGLLTIQPEAGDDLGIERVEITLDGKLVSTLRQAPYAYPWQALAGKHDLQITVFDLAGNSAQAVGKFVLTQK